MPTVQSDLAKVSQVHFHAMLRLLQEEVIQLPPTSPSPHRQPTAPEEDHTHSSHTQSSQGPPKPPVQMQQFPTSAQYSSSPAASSFSSPSSSLAPSATVPAQVHSYSASSTSSYSGQSYQPSHFTGAPPPPHPHPQLPTMPLYPAPQDSSGGQFYTRRSAGTYRY